MSDAAANEARVSDGRVRDDGVTDDTDGKPFGLAVVGAGRIARMGHLPAIVSVRGVRLVGVVDRHADRAAAAARDFGATWSATALSPALADPEVEGVVLCTPHDVHCEGAVAAARSGKHVLVEKPMANTVAECDRMIAAAAAAGVVLMVAHVFRFMHSYRTAKALLDSGRIGRPLSISAIRRAWVPAAPTSWWPSAARTNGLVIALNGSHAFDSLFWLLGTTPIAVSALSSTTRSGWEGEDEAMVQLLLASGCLAHVHLSFNARVPVNQLTVVGTEGEIQLLEERLLLDGAPVDLGLYQPERYGAQLRAFVAAARAGGSPVPPREARLVVATIDAARRSAAAGGQLVEV